MRPEADLDWYTKISRDRGVTPRCPYAALSRCPRYFTSASLAKYVGAAALAKEDEEKFNLQWRSSELWSQSSETETSVSGGDTAKALDRFCPEFVHDVFGVFAESLYPYYDSEEKEHMLKMFECPSGGVSPGWRFRWSDIKERHYTDCPLYSMLSVQTSNTHVAAQSKEADLMQVKPGAFGLSLDLKVLLTRFCRWWLKKN